MSAGLDAVIAEHRKDVSTRTDDAVLVILAGDLKLLLAAAEEREVLRGALASLVEELDELASLPEVPLRPTTSALKAITAAEKALRGER